MGMGLRRRRRGAACVLRRMGRRCRGCRFGGMCSIRRQGLVTSITVRWGFRGLALAARRLLSLSLFNNSLSDATEFGANAQHSVDSALLCLLAKHGEKSDNEIH